MIESILYNAAPVVFFIGAAALVAIAVIVLFSWVCGLVELDDDERL